MPSKSRGNRSAKELTRLSGRSPRVRVPGPKANKIPRQPGAAKAGRPSKTGRQYPGGKKSVGSGRKKSRA